ncbi:hypothetical protein COU79_03440 [Candidatus Peregrinibacteria bacterium CG10_big_fil_rev_8_21_14_0_10_54_7]|nr:MAG: hypothetical protein COU79_03440 [Candidatus Peregrinibacteria bacterium CG10_big_fil_rev_8_21_14_0_10_54_7]
MTVGEYLSRYLEKKGLKQSELAEKAGLDKRIINSWIKRGYVPREELLLKVLKVLPVPNRDKVKLLAQVRNGTQEISNRRRSFGTRQKINFGNKKMTQQFTVNFHYEGIRYAAPLPERLLSLEQAIGDVNKPMRISGNCIIELKSTSELLPTVRWSLRLQNLHRMANLGFAMKPKFEIQDKKNGKWFVQDDEENEWVVTALRKQKKLSPYIFYDFLLGVVSTENARWSVRLNDEGVFPVPFALGEEIGKLLDVCILDFEMKKRLSETRRPQLAKQMREAKQKLYTTAYDASSKAILTSWLMTYFREKRDSYPLPT